MADHFRVTVGVRGAGMGAPLTSGAGPLKGAHGESLDSHMLFS